MPSFTFMTGLCILALFHSTWLGLPRQGLCFRDSLKIRRLQLVSAASYERPAIATLSATSSKYVQLNPQYASQLEKQ